jgi:hypothetical protein
MFEPVFCQEGQILLDELKRILGERIKAAAVAGETDPARLCRTAIQGLFFSPDDRERNEYLRFV